MARPTKLNPKTQKRIVDALLLGASRKAAVEAGGISFSAYIDWMQRGEDELTGPYRAFREAVIQAEAEVELQFTKVIQEAALGVDVQEITETTKTEIRVMKTKHPDGRVVEEPIPVEVFTRTVTTRREFDWRAGESWLKRRRREEWGDSVTHEGADGQRGELPITEVIIERPGPADGKEPLEGGTG